MDVVGLAFSWIESFGYFAIVFLLVIGSLGFPLPEEPILLLAGYLASIGIFKLHFVLIFSVMGIIIGDNLGYWTARKKGLDFVMRYGELFFVKKSHLQKAEVFFSNHGGKAVFFARFLIGLRFFGPILAGVSKMKWPRFLFYDLIGIILWVPLIISLGYIFGAHFASIISKLNNIEHWIFAFGLIGITLFLVRQIVKE